MNEFEPKPSDTQTELETFIEGNAEIKQIIGLVEAGEVPKEEMLKMVREWNDNNYNPFQEMYSEKSFDGPNGLKLKVLRDKLGNAELRISAK